MSDDDLMQLFAALTRWTDHIAGQLVLQEISERYANSAYDLVYQTEFSRIMGGKTKTEGAVTAVKAETHVLDTVKEHQQIRDEVYARRKVLAMMLANLERDTNLVSRELTRRTSSAPREHRSGSYSA